MRQNTDIPRARSEPASIQDNVVSMLLERADELTEWQQSRGQSLTNSAPLPTLLEGLCNLVEQDAELARLLDALPQALGSGLLLQGVFTRLFPTQPQPIVVSRSAVPSPKLTDRERVVLLEMAKGHSKKEIAERLFISTGTVKKHFDNVYAKLEVNSPPEAVAKAAGLGLLTFDFLVDVLLHIADGTNLDFNHFAFMFLGSSVYGHKQIWSERIRRIAILGLLLFLLAPLVPVIDAQRTYSMPSGQWTGLLFELTPDGRLLRSFDVNGRLIYPYALAFAPPTANRHGFTPGNLFVINGNTGPDALNGDSILEFTTDGRYVRTFTGGEYLSTRLYGSGDIAFTPEGKLLVTSGDRTDALLEFTKGGRLVRRFADLVPYGGITADQRGNIYFAGGRWAKNPVHVFSPQGELLRTIGAGQGVFGIGGAYRGVAVDTTGRIYVANIIDALIEVYNTQGKRCGTIGADVLQRPYYLALNSNGRLYVLDGDPSRDSLSREGRCSVIHVFDSDASLLFSFPAPENALLTNLTFGPNGNVFVVGHRA